ncbi:S4 domain-containing protein [Paludibacterium purpuratum]|uniref:Dual-specificity RNA pseudouridine synthase RluF n=1 Tax=Paludibacterium purpuratum TaxID=1144873 RepID=A0A4R7AXT6_9NEIS|nr:RNA pseudouridine synthase [Paludibacterium purpuratum]TDR71098.1 23S rRNA pseudouridine2604 synthase [Paludibacterium purpuratum]
MEQSTGVRLAKRMVELGLCSRREADEYIEQGLVKVDGEVVRVLGSRVEPHQHIELTRPATPLADVPVTLLYHRKPGDGGQWRTLLNVDTRWQDDHDEQVFLPRHLRQLHAFGATDDTCGGLLALTQDRRLLKKLAECEMEFLIAVDAAPALEALKQATVGKLSRQSDRQLRLVMTQPAPGQIAALCAELGAPARSIRCIRIGRLALGKLPDGQWRYLQGWERF